METFEKNIFETDEETEKNRAVLFAFGLLSDINARLAISSNLVKTCFLICSRRFT